MQYIITTHIKGCAKNKCGGPSNTTFGIFPTEKKAQKFIREEDCFTQEMAKNAKILPLNVIGLYTVKQIGRMFRGNVWIY